MKRIESFPKLKQPRRGALLLVVLSILVLFALVGLTFVVAAAAYKTGADSNNRSDPARFDPPSEMDDAVKKLLRGSKHGTTNRTFGHELLRDMYGNRSVIVDGSKHSTNVGHPSSTNQLLQIDITPSTTATLGLSPVAEYYAGSIITFMQGNAKGQSHRILRYIPQLDANGAFQSVRIVIDQDPETTRDSIRGNGLPGDNDSFVVNDMPFNGVGYGYNPIQVGNEKRTLDLEEDNTNDPIAYMINISQAYPRGVVRKNVGGTNQDISIEVGGADESYDAPDYQNVYLSYIPQDTGLTDAQRYEQTIPSFHRQDLLFFLLSQNSTFATLSDAEKAQAIRDPDGPDDMAGTTDRPWDTPTLNPLIKRMLRKAMLRPNQLDHPDFDGSNPNFNPLANGEITNERWDIDNDLDGVTDSVWVDMGFPVKTAKDGRRYKPLAAILIRDMDGLVNVNTAGSYAHFDQFDAGLLPDLSNANTASAQTNVLSHSHFSPAWNPPASNSSTPLNMVFPLGSGYGPADISMLKVFTSPVEAYRLLAHRYGGNQGRPGASGVDDARSQLGTIGIPNDFHVTYSNQIGSPTDRLGIGRTYFDMAGRPRSQPNRANTVMTNMTASAGQAYPGGFTERTDDPYEADLNNDNGYDTPFTYQELEHIARYEEFDSSEVRGSENRMLQNAKAAFSTGGNSRRNRRLVTVASFQVPTAGRVDIPRTQRTITTSTPAPPNPLLHNMRTNAPDNVFYQPTLVTLCQNRLYDNGSGSGINDPRRLNYAVRQLLPPEIMRGEPLDLNRMLESPPNNADDPRAGSANAPDNIVDDIFELQVTQGIPVYPTGVNSTGVLRSTTKNQGWFSYAYYDTGNMRKVTFGALRPPVFESVLRIPQGNREPDMQSSDAASYSASRQLLARHLYVMMLLLIEDGYHFPAFDPSITSNATEREELTKRRIAQWAINAVDFRDKDAVMTPFEYDLNPFLDDTGSRENPWNVDGDLHTDEGSAFRRVVWGAEAPDLLLTETLAFHDRGIKDTEWDADGRRGSGMGDDPTLDQYKVPQGSLFLEFYNPRNIPSNNPARTTGINSNPAAGLPSELYNANGELLLNKRVRNSNNGSPVWRVLITEREETGQPTTPSSVMRDMANRVDTINFQPTASGGTDDYLESSQAGMAMLPTANEGYKIDRFIYFTNLSTLTNFTYDPDRTFYFRGNAGTDVGVRPNQYFVVAPRMRTYIGSKPDVANDRNFNIEGSRLLEIVGDQNQGIGTFRATQGGSLTGFPRDYPPAFAGSNTNNLNEIQQNVAIAVSMDKTGIDVDGLPAGIGLNITEPFASQYYPEPLFENPAAGATPPPSGAITQYYTDGPGNPTPYTDPFEGPSGNSNYPLNDDQSSFGMLYQTGTYPNKSGSDQFAVAEGYKDAVLQRLANPYSNYHEYFNPYITVDTMPIDLTVYNGEDGWENYQANPPATNALTGTAGANQWDPSETSNAQALNTVFFGSRERGKREDGNADIPDAEELTESPSGGNLAGMGPQLTGDTIGTGNEGLMTQTLSQTPPYIETPRNTGRFPQEHFGRPLFHTLGYLNRSLGSPIGSGFLVDGPMNNASRINPQYVGSPYPSESRTRAANLLTPGAMGANMTTQNNPFAWLHWPNGPYVSKYDLMMVPTSSPQRLLYEYSLIRKNGTAEFDPYNVANTPDGNDPNRFFSPYTYLFDFFHGTSTHAKSSGTPPAQLSAQLARIFDFVTVPSRYTGTKKYLAAGDFNPANPYTTGTGEYGPGRSDELDAREGYLAPFNYRSMFREPGKINLNTIPAQAVYESIFDPAFWQNGVFAGFPSWNEFQKSRQGFDDTMFGSENFPSRFSNPFRSAASSEMVPDLPPGGVGQDVLKVAPVNSTILRSKNPNGMFSSGSEQPLFDLRLSNSGADTLNNKHYRTDENPMLRYQAYQRLANTTGTQSNVFAVWITIGYFEVEPHEPQSGPRIDDAHPDGWALGQELGLDTGDVTRHRGFYIIDRSVPVGYLPGEDLNVEDTIKLRRFIE
ncbi:hypothetical protein [Blastopirellula marina]|uniref:Verru_Chthon cassette protein A n=1 Tax=Blastopirellula marina TaxID=124 RepID=A0A2S8GCU0_9BACT|nr:hypothetical protein [Blastopirellula marina]PQO42278.1 hypothetical protein C5Y93_28470 [Blastopirellula marina]